MKGFAALFALAAAAWSGTAAGASIGQIDTFEDGTTAGWFAGGLGTGQVPPVPPHVVDTGGPAGADDAYLVVTAAGGDGPGSRLVAMNASQWAGDYLQAGFSGIAMDLLNLGASDLAIRLLFEDPVAGPPANEAVSTVPVVLPAGSGWVHAVFPIRPSDLTALLGSGEGALGGATLVRIVHAPTAGDAAPVAGILGVDNIAAVPEPATVAILATALAALAVHRRRTRLTWRARARP